MYKKLTKILTLVLPLVALGLCAIPGSYRLELAGLTQNEPAQWLITSFYDIATWQNRDVGPLLCVGLTGLTFILSAVSYWWQNDRFARLVLYASLAALTAPMLTLFVGDLTLWGWLIIAVLAANVFFRLQLAMELEDKNRKK